MFMNSEVRKNQSFQIPVFCKKLGKHIMEGDCTTHILNVTDRNDLTVCRETCEQGIRLRSSCPYDAKWRKHPINELSFWKKPMPKETFPKIETHEPVVNLEFANNLKKARIKMGYSQNKLAEISKCGVRSIQRWEKGYGISDEKKQILMNLLEISE